MTGVFQKTTSTIDCHATLISLWWRWIGTLSVQKQAQRKEYIASPICKILVKLDRVNLFSTYIHEPKTRTFLKIYILTTHTLGFPAFGVQFRKSHQPTLDQNLILNIKLHFYHNDLPYLDCFRNIADPCTCFACFSWFLLFLCWCRLEVCQCWLYTVGDQTLMIGELGIATG